MLFSLALPHFLAEDDVYRRYQSQRGQLSLATHGNSPYFSTIDRRSPSCVYPRAMLHDESEYPDPYSFKPERFLKDGQLDPDVRGPAEVAFGYGRRYDWLLRPTGSTSSP